MARNVSSSSQNYPEVGGSKFLLKYGCRNKEYYNLFFHLLEKFLSSLMTDRYFCSCSNLRKNMYMPSSPRINTNLHEDKVGGVSAEIPTEHFPSIRQNLYLQSTHSGLSSKL
jgi:hypothetical protein